MHKVKYDIKAATIRRYNRRRGILLSTRPILKKQKQPTSVFLVLAVHCSKLYSAKTALNTTKKKLARTAKRRRKEMETGFLKSENISQ